MTQNVWQRHEDRGQGKQPALASPSVSPAPSKNAEQQHAEGRSVEDKSRVASNPSWERLERAGCPQQAFSSSDRLIDELLAEEKVQTGPRSPAHAAGGIVAH